MASYGLRLCACAYSTCVQNHPSGKERGKGGEKRAAPPVKVDRFAKEKKKAREAQQAAENAASERAAAEVAKEASTKRRKKASKSISQRDHRGRPLVRNTISRMLEKLS